MAATAPHVNLGIFTRALEVYEQTNVKAAIKENQRVIALSAKTHAGPVPAADVIRIPDETDEALKGRWARIVDRLPGHLRELINLASAGLDMYELSQAIGLPLITVWDRALEAHTAVLFVAGQPIVNRRLEEWLQNKDLWPKDARPFPGDIGAVIRNMPWKLREGLYARIANRTASVEADWGLKPSTFCDRWARARDYLFYYGRAFGLITPPPNMELVSAWALAGAMRLGRSSPISGYGARLGFGYGPYTWPQAREIWIKTIRHEAYQALLTCDR
ncbi:MAG TPA: hypothetical protein VNT01_10190 [Symbiobacteriaceae bacterium]|nr:hypothetical protein [Symbiobacteriaceae bacterium]